MPQQIVRSVTRITLAEMNCWLTQEWAFQRQQGLCRELCPIWYQDTLIRVLFQQVSDRWVFSPCCVLENVHLPMCSTHVSICVFLSMFRQWFYHDSWPAVAHAQACLHGWANDVQVSCAHEKGTLGTRSAKGSDGSPSTRFWYSVPMRGLALDLYASERGDRGEARTEEKWRQVSGGGRKLPICIPYLQDKPSQGMSPGCPRDTFQGDLWGQNYFQNTVKMLFAISTHSFMNVESGLFWSTSCVIPHRMDCRSRSEKPPSFPGARHERNLQK